MPVDLITGTSMGAIIGGLYAAGYSPDQMQKIVEEIDWDDVFDDVQPRSQRAFRRKEDERSRRPRDYSFLASLELGVKKTGLALPWGLVQGQKLNLILRRLFLPVAFVNDFDDLHVPFRAVSTDVVTGEPVVHKSGDLATAVRASMSLPGVFAPVELDGHLLVDGGVSNNTPVDLALQLGADVLIVVEVGTPLAPHEKITNAAAIVGQVVSLMVVSTTKRQLALMRPQDILIRPDLEGVSTASFELGSTVVPRGVRAAREKLAELDRLAVPEAEHARMLAVQRHGESAPPTIERVEVANNSRLRNEVLQARLATQAGEPLDVERLAADLQEIYGLEAFERVDYALDSTDGGADLGIVAREKSWGPAYLRLGVNLEENFENTSEYNLAINFTIQPINGLGGEWRSDLIVGSTQRLLTEFWQPLDAESRYFVAPSFEFRRERFPEYDGDERTGEFVVRHTNFALDVGRQFSNWGELRLGVIYDFGHARTVVGTTGAPDSFRTGGAFARLAVDTLDSVHFPTQGTVAWAAFGLVREALGADDSYEIVYGGLGHAFTYRRNTLLLVLEGQTVWGGAADAVEPARLGGFQRLSGLDRHQLSGRHSALANAVAYRRIAAPRVFSVSYPVYAGLSFEVGNVAEQRDELLDELILAGSAFIGMETPLGPIYFAYGYAESGRDSLYLYLGRTF